MPMVARTFTDEELVEAWATIDGIAAVARALGATYATVNNRAMRLRLAGVPLRRMPRTPRAGCVIARTRPTGIDPAELRDLVEAFRNRDG